jgi:putative DNA primase/helicase
MNFSQYLNKNDSEENIVLSSINYLTQFCIFVTLKDTEEIYRFDKNKGIFVAGGDQFIKSEIVATYRNITTKEMNEIINHIKWETYIDRDELDPDIEWLACKNCMINLSTGETMPHSSDFMATVQIPVTYQENPFSLSEHEINQNKNVCCPKIMRFLYQVLYNKRDVETILDFLAYCLWREMKFHKILILHGEGRNGKGTLCNLISSFFGNKQVSNESLDQLSNSRFSSSQLFGKFVNIDQDLSERKLTKTGVLKKLSGNDQLSAEKKFQPQFNFTNFAKMIVVTNELPEVDDDTIAFFSRLVIIDFSKTFLENANPDLIKELTTQEELSGLLTVLLKRLQRVLKHGISYNKSVEEITSKYQFHMNSVKFFVDEYIENCFTNIRKDIVYKEYKAFCYKNKIPPKSEYTFSQVMSKIGFSYGQLRNGQFRSYYWMNVRIKNKSF